MGFIYSNEECWSLLERGTSAEEAKRSGIEGTRYRAWHDRANDENRFRMFWLDRDERSSRGPWTQVPFSSFLLVVLVSKHD